MVLWGVLNQFAIELHWYWTFWWFDILMHAMGGFIVALGGLIFFISSPLVDRLLLRRSPLFAAVIGSGGMGLLWEAYEAMVGIIDLPEYLPDSVFDVSAGLAGGLVAYLLIVHHRRAVSP